MIHSSSRAAPLLIIGSIICLFSIVKTGEIFMETTLDCIIQYNFANSTIGKFGENWKVELEKRRNNFTAQLGQCRDELNTTNYPPTVDDLLDYEIDVASYCPGARTNWVIVAIVFIIAFLIALGAFATVSILFYRNLKQNDH